MANDELKNVISKVAEADKSKEEKAEQYQQMMIFELDKEEYAVPLTELQSVILVPEITPIPNAPEFIRGILNLRGKIVVVVDLEKRFKLVRENELKPKHIVVVETNGNQFGVLVDEVKEVLQIPKSSIQPTPDLVSTKIHADYLQGVIVLSDKTKGDVDESDKEDSRLLILLDLPKLLQEKELLQIGEAIKKTSKTE